MDSINRETNWPEVERFVPTHSDTYPFISLSDTYLTGRSVCIFGASRGIGRSTAIRFAVAGASTIIIAARSSLDEVEKAIYAAASNIRAERPRVLCLPGTDISDEASVGAAAKACEKACPGGLDVVIINAAQMGKPKLVAASNTWDWWHTWEVNVKGAYLCARIMLPLLLRGPAGAGGVGGGVVQTDNELTRDAESGKQMDVQRPQMLILVTSAGALNLHPTASAYQMSKLAVCRLAEFLDREYRRKGLVVLSLHPGGVKTEMATAWGQGRLVGLGVLGDSPELAADTMVWLAKEKRPWLGGRFVSVNWDMEKLLARKDEIVSRNLLRIMLSI